MNMRWFAWLTALVCAIAGRASAEPRSPGLHWSRADNAADCVDPRTLAELVEAYTGPVLVAPANADESIEGAIERTASDAFSVRISVSVARGRPTGERVLSLRASDCRKLDGAIALVIATTLNPDLGAGALPSELGWLQPSETAPAEQLREELANTKPASARPIPPPSAAEASSPANVTTLPMQASSDQPPRRDAWELGVAASLGSGVVPKTNAGALVTIAHAFGPAFALTMQLRGNAILGGFDLVSNRHVGVETFGGALLACGRVGAEHSLGMQACLGPEVGWFRAHGTGFDAAHVVVQPVYDGLAKLELRYEIADAWSITAAGLFGLGFRRPTVTYRNLQPQLTLFRSELYSIQGALGLVRSF